MEATHHHQQFLNIKLLFRTNYSSQQQEKKPYIIAEPNLADLLTLLNLRLNLMNLAKFFFAFFSSHLLPKDLISSSSLQIWVALEDPLSVATLTIFKYC